MNDIRWRGRSHQEIYDEVWSGPGHLGSAGAQQMWGDVISQLGDVDRTLTSATGLLGEGWEGTAAGEAFTNLKLLGSWVTSAARTAEVTGTALDSQAEHVATMRNNLPPPPPPVGPSVRSVILSPIPPLSVGSLLVDLAEQDAREVEAANQAVQVMETYTSNSAQNKPHIYSFATPITVTSESAGTGALGSVFGRVAEVARNAAGLLASSTQGAAFPGTGPGAVGAAAGAAAGLVGPGVGGAAAGAAGLIGPGVGGAGAAAGVGAGIGGGVGGAAAGGVPGVGGGAGAGLPVPFTPGVGGAGAGVGAGAGRGAGLPGVAGRPGQVPGLGTVPGTGVGGQQTPGLRAPGEVGSRIPGGGLGGGLGRLDPSVVGGGRGLPGGLGSGPGGVGLPGGAGSLPGGGGGAGEPGATGRGPGTTTGGATTAAGNGRPAGSGFFPGGAGAGAGGQGGEHRRPSYLIDDTDAFGDDRWFTAQVITPDDHLPRR